MKTKLTLILYILIFNVGCAQNNNMTTNQKFIAFIKSFKKTNSTEILDFRQVIFLKNPMTKEEALNFVYHSYDTTRLYCRSYIFSMETEKISGINTYLSLPDKSLLIDMEKYYFVAYNSYDGYELDKASNTFLHILIVDKNYNIKDSLLAYHNIGRYDWDEDKITGLLNPTNGKVFLLNLTLKNSKMAYMYEVNKETLKFELIKEEKIDNYTYDLFDMLDKLEWDITFLE